MKDIYGNVRGPHLPVIQLERDCTVTFTGDKITDIQSNPIWFGTLLSL